ncbi:WYL domain-containing protein, partial [Mycobacterium kiyosense]|uniref:WYL domain-containing protein n=2 Tax=Mycobacteriaceae TaxID=1762 RepID=UPI00222F0DB0
AIASPPGVPGLRGSEDVLGILLAAIESRQAVQFPHRPSRAEPYVTRTVEPWGVITEKGRWYLVGHDRDRNATRTFRISRIGAGVKPVGEPGAVRVPDGLDLSAIVAAAVAEAEAPSGAQATVWVADGRATALRRAGRSLGPRRLAGRDGEVIEIDIGSSDRLARDVTGYGADAIVVAPPSLREDVLDRLRAAAGIGEPPA